MNNTSNVTSVTDVTKNQGMINLRGRVREHWDKLSKAERTVSTFLTNSSPERLLYASAQELGAESGTSSATVVRTVQSLEYSGLQELKRDIATPFTSTVAPEVRMQQRIDHMGASIEDIWHNVWSEAKDRLELASSADPAEAIAPAVELLMRGSTIVSYGVGASGLAALNLALRCNRIGRRARCISSDGFRLADDLLQLGSQDVVVVFAPGRVTVDVEVLLKRARSVGASTVLLTDEPDSALHNLSDAVILAPHTPTGMTTEALPSIVLSDVLVQALVSVDHEQAVESSHQLTALREQLGY